MIILSMIVKNEEESIANTLESVKPFVDAWLICDTGSTDRTVEIVEETMRGIYGGVTSIPFEDFATTRNAALQQAENFCYPIEAGDYILCLDADDILYGGENLREAVERNRGEIEVYERGDEHDPQVVDAYTVEMAQGPFTWQSTRVVRAGAGWRYRGEVHEVLLSPSGERATASIPGVRVVHTPTRIGEERSRKRWERDLEILKYKNDPRSVFYRGLTNMWLGNDEEAISDFALRLVMGGWEEECFLSHYHIIHLSHASRREYLGDLERLFEMYPHRAEPLYDLECHIRARLEDVRARRLEIPKPEGGLFVDERAYGVRR